MVSVSARIIKNKYSENWEVERNKEMRDLLKKGVIPYTTDVELLEEKVRAETLRAHWSSRFLSACGPQIHVLILFLSSTFEEWTGDVSVLLFPGVLLICARRRERSRMCPRRWVLMPYIPGSADRWRE